MPPGNSGASVPQHKTDRKLKMALESCANKRMRKARATGVQVDTVEDVGVAEAGRAMGGVAMRGAYARLPWPT